MKLMLGNGWEQEVKLDADGNEVIRYLKDGGEYTKQEWEEKVKEEKIRKLAWESMNKVGGFGLQVEAIENIQLMLGRLAEDATQMKHDDNDKFFLWDNDHVIQVLDNLLYRISKEINEDHKEMMKIQGELYDVIVNKENDGENINNGK